jgi:methionyl-tRNA formyltransferase
MVLAFAGTAAFAVPILIRLHAEGHQVRLVITQPDRPSGRGMELTPPPVKMAAQGLGLPVSQPQRLRDPEVEQGLVGTEVDALIVAAYGQILRPAILRWPRLGAINVHASLLPKYRGPAPVAAAILHGDPVTGVCIMQMDEGVDTGPVWARREIRVAPVDTTLTLTERLAEAGAALLIDTLPRLGTGEVPAPQPLEGASRTQRLRKEDGHLSWNLSAEEIDRRVRAYTPWPGCWAVLGGLEAKLIKGRPTSSQSVAGLKPGEIVKVPPRGIDVNTGRGIYTIEQLQLAGKRVMDAQEFARGRR